MENLYKQKKKHEEMKSFSSQDRKAGYVRIKKKTFRKVLITVILLLLLAAGVLIALLYNRGPDLDKNAIAYQLPDGVKNTDPDSILLPGFDVLEMNYATQKVDAAFLNPEGNECFFTYSVTLKSDGTRLYQTGLIKPGTAVTSFQAEKKLEKGEYPIIILVEASDMKEPEKKYNGGAVEAVLEVK